MALQLRQMQLSAKRMYGPLLKITQFSAHAKHHVGIKLCRKTFTTIVLGDHDFPLIASNFGNLTAKKVKGKGFPILDTERLDRS